MSSNANGDLKPICTTDARRMLAGYKNGVKSQMTRTVPIKSGKAAVLE